MYNISDACGVLFSPTALFSHRIFFGGGGLTRHTYSDIAQIWQGGVLEKKNEQDFETVAKFIERKKKVT
jgi:hypothetical protein